jgi:hypothetical protein
VPAAARGSAGLIDLGHIDPQSDQTGRFTGSLPSRSWPEP